MAATALGDKFQHATDYVKALPKDGPVQLGNDDKLKMYALFKQATVGDVEGSQPWMTQFEARAKWDAWAENKGMSNDDAMSKYIELLVEKSGGEYKPLE